MAAEHKMIEPFEPEWEGYVTPEFSNATPLSHRPVSFSNWFNWTNSRFKRNSICCIRLFRQ